MTAGLLFDESLTGLGGALRWAYGARVLVSIDVPELRTGALDPAIITFCRKRGVMWVTKDWAAGIVDERVRQLKADGVSVWWLRAEQRKQMRRPDMLWAAARDIELVLFALDTERGPIYISSSVGSRARHIEIPYVHRRGRGRSITPPPPKARRRKITHGLELFPQQ